MDVVRRDARRVRHRRRRRTAPRCDDDSDAAPQPARRDADAGDATVPRSRRSRTAAPLQRRRGAAVDPDSLPREVVAARGRGASRRVRLRARATSGSRCTSARSWACIQSVTGVVSVDVNEFHRSRSTRRIRRRSRTSRRGRRAPGAAHGVVRAELLTLDPRPLDLEVAHMTLDAERCTRCCRRCTGSAMPTPAHARAASGGPLQALLAVVAEQLARVDDNIDQLYDDLFIETCATWVVPYIGDLIGVPRRAPRCRGRGSASALRRQHDRATAGARARRRCSSSWRATSPAGRRRRSSSSSRSPRRSTSITSGRRHRRRPSSFADRATRPRSRRSARRSTRVAHTADVRRIEPRPRPLQHPERRHLPLAARRYPLTDAPAYAARSARYPLRSARQRSCSSSTIRARDRDHAPGRTGQRAGADHAARDRCDLKNQAPDPLDDYGASKSLVAQHRRQRRSIADADIDICDLSDVGAGWAHTPAAGQIAIDPGSAALRSPRLRRRSRRPRDLSLRLQRRHRRRRVRARPSFGCQHPPHVARGGTCSALTQSRRAAAAVVADRRQPTYSPKRSTFTRDVRRTPRSRCAARNAAPSDLMLQGDRPILAEVTAEVTLNGLLISGTIRVPAVDASGARTAGSCGCGTARSRLDPAADLRTASAHAEPACRRAPRRAHRDRTLHRRQHPRRRRTPASDRQQHRRCRRRAQRRVRGAGRCAARRAADGSTQHRHRQVCDADDDARVQHDLPRRSAAGDAWPAPVRAERLQEGCTRFSYVPPGSRVPRLYRCQPRRRRTPHACGRFSLRSAMATPATVS